MTMILHKGKVALPKGLKPSKKTILLIITIVFITLLTSSLLAIWLAETYDVHLASLGIIKTQGVEAYWDVDLTDKIDEEINWGTLWLGSSNNVTITLLSISNIPTTINLQTNLTFYDINEIAINPSGNILDYMNLTWDYHGHIIKPEEAIPVILTLSSTYSIEFISFLIENNVRNFTLDIHISTEEYLT